MGYIAPFSFLLSLQRLSHYRYPNGLAPFLGLNDSLFHTIEPEARIEHHANLHVLAHKYVPLGVHGRVAGVYA